MELTPKDEELKTVSLFISWIQLEVLVERANTHPFRLVPGEPGFWAWVQITHHVLKAASRCDQAHLIPPGVFVPAQSHLQRTSRPTHLSVVKSIRGDFVTMSPPS